MAGLLVGTEITVDSAGTAQPLATSQTLVKTASARAKRTNTGNIYIGDSDVDDTQNDGFAAGDLIALPAGLDAAYDLAHVWIDADTNDEGIDLWYQPFQ
jgi:hypothetical protein